MQVKERFESDGMMLKNALTVEFVYGTDEEMKNEKCTTSPVNFISCRLT